MSEHLREIGRVVGRAIRGLILLATLLVASQRVQAQSERFELAYAPSPPDNPLMGLVPYAEQRDDPFPHSMEFDYVPFAALVTAPGTYNWNRLEELLDDVAERGHQAIFRVYLEYPGKRDGIPQFLIDRGLQTQRYRASGEMVVTPDYDNALLRAELTGFVRALGERYDGDPRIA